jgi:hypothetical protein
MKFAVGGLRLRMAGPLTGLVSLVCFAALARFQLPHRLARAWLHDAMSERSDRGLS